MLDTRQPLLFSNIAEWDQARRRPVGRSRASLRTPTWACRWSWATRSGAISLQNIDREHAFSESDLRLLSTLATSLSVALENVRLFAETKRLLTETDERNAELAIINSVQQGLAQQLDMQAMYDLVGDQIRDIFDAQVVGIDIYDTVAGTLSFPYSIERGEPLPNEPIPIADSTMSTTVLETRQPLYVRDAVAWHEETGAASSVQGEMAMSVLMAPMIVGGEVRGRISIQNIDRVNAFSDSDVRLLTTLAGSLSVALENARLFDETKRLLTETDERAAELSIINSVQQSLAANLDMESMYDLVGTKIQEIFDAQVVLISLFDAAAGTMRFRFGLERGERLVPEDVPISGLARRIVETREPIAVNENWQGWLAEQGLDVAVIGEAPKSVVFAPLVAGDAVRGAISIQNVDREHAFSESDVRLLSTLASSLSVALENARLFDETRRLLAETDRPAAELAITNSVQRGLAAELEIGAMYELVGERASRRLRHAGRRYCHLRP